MPNRLTLSVTDHKADDYINWFNALEQGLYSTSGMGTEFKPGGTVSLMTDAGTMELRVDYVTIGGEIHATGVSGFYDEVEIHFTATFANPEPLGVPVWTDMLPLALYDALLGDTMLDMRGSTGKDWAVGFDFNDRFQMGKGHDAAAGRDGNDVLLGGRGKDLLMGGADDDVLKGGGGRDMLIAGPGNDTVKGGGGDDVLVLDGGNNNVDGGKGDDIFIIETFQNAPPNTNGFTRSTWANKWDPDDLLVFAGFSVSPDTIDPFAVTLQDVQNGTVDEFRWFQRADDLVIRAGDSKLTMHDTTADQLDLDLILFTEKIAVEPTTLFDSNSTGGLLGTSLAGDPYLTITMTNFTRVSDGTNSFDTYGGDISGFYMGAFPMI